MTTKLQLYKRAALKMGTTPPASLSEGLEVRRVMDVHYTDVLDWFLEQGFWEPALRTVSITENTSVTEAFGFAYAHDIPSDYKRMFVLSPSETLNPPLDQFDGGNGYLKEGGYFWADVTPIYLKYVSNDSSYGYDLTAWTDSMAEAFAAELAHRSISKVSGATAKKDDLEKEVEKKLGTANTISSLEQPTTAQREGRWTGRRWGNRARRYDRA